MNIPGRRVRTTSPEQSDVPPIRSCLLQGKNFRAITDGVVMFSAFDVQIGSIIERASSQFIGCIVGVDHHREYFEWVIALVIDPLQNHAIMHGHFRCQRILACPGNCGIELFNREGNMFTYYYYGGGLYRADYDEVLVKSLPSIYHVTDSWENYDKMKQRTTLRYQDWKKLTGN